MKMVAAFSMSMFEPGLLHLISETGIAMVNWKGRISPITELRVAAAFKFRHCIPTLIVRKPKPMATPCQA